jgi:6-phosphogluconolactonase
MRIHQNTNLMRKLLSLALVLFLGVPGISFKEKTVLFYIGSQDKTENASISLCELDLSTGKITLKDSFKTSPGPGYVSISPNKKNLYAVTSDNKISAYAIGADQKLTYLNSQASEGINPCHVSVDASGKMAFVSNYTGGSFTAYTLGADGKVNPATYSQQFTGAGPNEKRQEKPHAHFTFTTPNGKYAYVTDLGTDHVMNYVVNTQTGELKPNPAQAAFNTKPGAGPRHFVISPSGKYLYLLNELDLKVTACSISETGVINAIASYPTIPADFKEPSTSAAIHLHPNGKFVYTSNRGHNSISAFEIQPNGELEKVGEVTQAIKTPRDFNIDPTGKYMIVANQDKDNLVVYEINAKTGKLTFKQESIAVRLPICVAFL